MIMMVVGVAAICCLSSAGAGVAYWQNWLCDSLGEEFGNSCPKKPAPSAGDEPVDSGDGDDSPSSSGDDDKDTKDDKKDDKKKDKKDDKKDDTNENKDNLIKKYDGMFESDGKAKSGPSTWRVFYHTSCKHPIWTSNGNMTLAENCGGNGVRLGGSYNKYKIYAHAGGWKATDPKAFKDEFGFYDIDSKGHFKIKNRKTGKWLKLNSCTAGKALGTTSSKSNGSKFYFRDGCK